MQIFPKIPGVYSGRSETPLSIQQLRSVICYNTLGTSDFIIGDFDPSITELPENGFLRLITRALFANTTTTPEFTPNISCINPFTIVKLNNINLIPGEISGENHFLDLLWDYKNKVWILLNPAFVTNSYLTENYVTNITLATILDDYVTSISLTNTLNNFVTNTTLTNTLSSYSTTSNMNTAINTALQNYATNSALSTTLSSALANYVTSSALSNTLSSYATNSALSTTLSSALANYVTSSALSNTLSSYATNSALSTTLSSALANYVTSSALSNTLSSYATNSALSTTLSSALANYVTSSALSNTLSAYVTNSALTTALENINLSNYVTTTALNTALSNIDLSQYATKAFTTNSYINKTGGVMTGPLVNYFTEVNNGLHQNSAINLNQNSSYVKWSSMYGNNTNGDNLFGINNAGSFVWMTYLNNTWVQNLTLDSSGNLTALSNITGYSDIKLKKDIKYIDNALSKVMSVNGYTYTRIDTDEKQTGVIAQEILTILPEAVKDNDGTLSVAYGNLVGLLIEAIKELKKELDDHVLKDTDDLK